MGVFSWIYRVIMWCIENWKLIGMIFVVVFVLSLTGNITITIKNVKRGFKEAWGPIGLTVLIVLSILIYMVAKSLENI